MNFLLGQLPLVLTVVSALAGFIGWGVGRIRHRYGMERDINHLKRDQESFSTNMGTLVIELERRLDDVEKQQAVLRGINQALISGQRQPD